MRSSSRRLIHNALRGPAAVESAAHGARRCCPRQAPAQTLVHRCGKTCGERKIPANRRLFAALVACVERLRRGSRRCYARPPRDPPRGASERVEQRHRADRRTPVGRRLRPAPGGTQRDDLRDLVRRRRRRASSSDDTFSLVVPNDFTREWIEGHFLGFVKAAARDALGARRPGRRSTVARGRRRPASRRRRRPPRAACSAGGERPAARRTRSTRSTSS